MHAEGVHVKEIERHLSNIEREIAELKRLIAGADQGELAGAEQLGTLRQQLIDEGFDEELVLLVGTIPPREENYKKEIQQAISEGQRSKTSECSSMSTSLWMSCRPGRECAAA